MSASTEAVPQYRGRPRKDSSSEKSDNVNVSKVKLKAPILNKSCIGNRLSRCKGIIVASVSDDENSSVLFSADEDIVIKYKSTTLTFLDARSKNGVKKDVAFYTVISYT